MNHHPTLPAKSRDTGRHLFVCVLVILFLLGIEATLPATPRPPADYPYERMSPRGAFGLISPDGVWRLAGGFPDWKVACRKTGAIRRVSFSEKSIQKAFGEMAYYFTTAIWLPDSKAWVTVVHSQTGLYGVKVSLRQKSIVDIVPLKYPPGTHGWPDMCHHHVLGMTKDSSILVLSGLDADEGFKHNLPYYYLYSFRFGRRTIRSWRVYLPAGKAFWNTPVYSLEENALAWVLYDEQHPQSCDIYRSDIHGAKLRLVSHLTQSPETSWLYRWHLGTFSLYNPSNETGQVVKEYLK